MKKLLGMIIAAILFFNIFPVSSISADNEATRKYQIKITVMKTDGSKPIEYTYEVTKSEENKIHRFSKNALIDLGNNYMHDAKLLGDDWPAYGMSALSCGSTDAIGCHFTTDTEDFWLDVLKETSGTQINLTIIYNGGAVRKEMPAKANLVCSAYYSISTTTSGGTIDVKTNALSGEKVEIVPTAAEGRILDSLTYCVEGGNPETIAKSEEGYFFEMPSADVTVSAIFKFVPQVTAPEGLSLKYNGENQKLIKEGKSSGGTLVYSSDNQTYSTDVPEEKDPGSYTIYYKVEGDDDYCDSDVLSVEAKIDNNYFVDSGDASSWQKGSADPLEIVFKAGYEDEETFNRFTDGGKILVDDKELSSECYDASSGSLKIKLKASYLETLSVGQHTMKAEFFDGISDPATFIIKEKPSQKDDDSSNKSSTVYRLPKTGIE